MKVPFADLTSQYRNLKPEIDQAIDSVLNSGNFIGGEPIRLFEKNFADALLSETLHRFGKWYGWTLPRA
jgi:dTDP-4-amino-4,6-dideoxygalactose transaminase